MFLRHPPPDPIDPNVRAALSRTQTSTLGHLRDFGFPRGLYPLTTPIGFVGPAFTVRIPHLDSTALHVAVDEIRPGDVLVVDQSGDDRSCFGGMVGFTAHHRGAAGAVVSGAVNDVLELKELGLPVFSSGVSARTTRIRGIEGALHVPVSIGGVSVHPGDIIFGDSDGLAVLSRDEADEIAGILTRKESREPELKRRILAGERLSELTGARARFDSGLERGGPPPATEARR